MDDLRTWVINLDRAPDRLLRITGQLQRLGLPWTRLRAVDAREMTKEQLAWLDETSYRRWHGMTPLPGELGCYLSHVAVMRAGTPVAVCEVPPAHRLAVMLSKCTGASAYLINRRAAQAYAAGLLPMRLPYDHVFDQGWRFGLKVRLVTPPPCGHDDVTPSTMGYADAPRRKFHWTKRGSTYAYRLGNELRRLSYGLRETLREKFS